ncbi:MAG: HAD hydrolase-like protein, partial [Oscillibacter sp.]|nr:HAD hydrolase-like protein [Oscillibacter sp.]
EYEPNMVCAVSASLTRLWLSREGRRAIQPGTADVLRTLNRRGYSLCILENTPAEDELNAWLVTEGLASCFRTVLLSSKIRLRKPDPAAYRLAARCADASVRECAFVGGPMDLTGAAAASFGLAVLLDSGESVGFSHRAGTAGNAVQAGAMEGLLDLFPDRRETA